MSPLPFWIRSTSSFLLLVFTCMLVLPPAHLRADPVTVPAPDPAKTYVDLFSTQVGENFLNHVVSIDGSGEGGFLTRHASRPSGRPLFPTSTAVFSNQDNWWMLVDFSRGGLPVRIVDCNGNEVLFSAFRNVGETISAAERGIGNLLQNPPVQAAALTSQIQAAPQQSAMNYGLTPQQVRDGLDDLVQNRQPSALVRVRNANGELLFGQRLLLPAVIILFAVALRNGQSLFNHVLLLNTALFSALLPSGLSTELQYYGIASKLFSFLMVGAMFAAISIFDGIPSLNNASYGTPLGIIAVLIGLLVASESGFLYKYAGLLDAVPGTFSTVTSFVLATALLAGGLWDGFSPYGLWLPALITLFAHPCSWRYRQFAVLQAIFLTQMFCFSAFPSLVQYEEE